MFRTYPCNESVRRLMQIGKQKLLDAVDDGDIQRVQGLISIGVEVNNYSEFPDGETPLNLAIWEKHVEIVKLLLQNGASVQGPEHNEYYLWPIHIAALTGCEKIVELLLRVGDVDTQLQARTKRGDTPLITAIAGNNVEIVKLLLRKGASVQEHDEDHWWPIHIAAQGGCEEIVELILQQGGIDVQLQARTKSHETPLMIATRNGHTSTSQILMNYDHVTVNARKTELLRAVQNGDLQKLAELISSGVEVNNYAEFPEGDSPLITAILGKNVEIVKVLLQNGASVQEHEENQWWPIHVAAQEGCEEIVELLLEEGDMNVQLQARTNDHETPLMIASENGHTSICELLMEKITANGPLDARKQIFWGAARNGDFSESEGDLLKSFFKSNEKTAKHLLGAGDIDVHIQPRTKSHKTPDMIASRDGRTSMSDEWRMIRDRGPADSASHFHPPDTLKQQLTPSENEFTFTFTFTFPPAGANLSFSESEKARKTELLRARKTELLRAARYGDHKKVVELISSGVEVNNYAEFPKGQTPLIKAIYGKHDEIIGKFLLQNGASVQEYDEEQWLPIHIAAFKGFEEIVKLLLGEGDIPAQLQARTESHSTPLMIASHNGHTSICQILICNGAEVNAVNNMKYSSLMLAASRGHESTMELLLLNEADPRYQNVYGRTALAIASTFGHLDAVRILLPKLGADDLLMEDGEGNTAAFQAARFAEFDIMELILKTVDGQQLWKSTKSTILHSLTNSGDDKLTRKHCNKFYKIIGQMDSHKITPAQSALRMSRIGNFKTLLQYQPELLQTDGINLMKLALQYAHPEVVDMIQNKKSILHTYNEWFLYLTSNAGKSQERMAILTEHIEMFSNRRQQMVKEAIANAIKNNHLDVLKKLLEWTMSPSELASIWPLWTAIDVGNDDITLYLLQLSSMFQDQVGPDGSSPLQLCLIRNNNKVLAALKDKSPDVVQTFTQSPSEKESFKEDEKTEFQRMLDANVWKDNQYVALCKSYPMFNEQCSLPFKVGQRTKKEFSFWTDVLPHSIDVSACIPTSLNDPEQCIGHFGDKKILACEILSNLVRFLFEIEAELNKPGSMMESLGSKFILIGSIPEGTRLGHPDELDMSTKFKSIKPTFFELNSSDAFGLKLSEVGVEFFTNVQENETFQQLHLPSLVMEDSMFNVLAFQHLFLTALEQAILRVEVPKNVKLGTPNSTFDIVKCEQCVKASKEEGTWMHCSECFPILAQTKRGVVLNLIWSNGDVEYKCSIDLVPMYPVAEKDLCKLFGSVFHTLTEKKPRGWRGSVGKHVHIDRPVHDAFVELVKSKSQGQDRPLLIAMKVLNYGPGYNYIQCPGQSTGIQHFASRRIREAYLFTKGLIKLLNLPVKSYYLKKMFLNSAIIDLSQTARNNQHFLLSVLIQPEWGTQFTDCLDMEKMEDEANTTFSQEFRAFLK